MLATSLLLAAAAAVGAICAKLRLHILPFGLLLIAVAAGVVLAAVSMGDGPWAAAAKFIGTSVAMQFGYALAMFLVGRDWKPRSSASDRDRAREKRHADRSSVG